MKKILLILTVVVSLIGCSNTESLSSLEISEEVSSLSNENTSSINQSEEHSSSSDENVCSMEYQNNKGMKYYQDNFRHSLGHFIYSREQLLEYSSANERNLKYDDLYFETNFLIMAYFYLSSDEKPFNLENTVREDNEYICTFNVHSGYFHDMDIQEALFYIEFDNTESSLNPVLCYIINNTLLDNGISHYYGRLLSGC
ncbi:MAG: hypothetical protein LBM99_05730 [Bacillales bacterium]|jgi:hypothetical protein|nr:hypothetical protein [Bacillales bacterium]